MRSLYRIFSIVTIAIAATLASSAATAQTEFKLTASDALAGDLFGRRVSMDGDYAIVGAFYDNDGGIHSGSAYIFVRSGTTWSQQAKLTASDAAENDLFGQSVSIDGDYAIVGAFYDDDGGSNSGSAYIFVRSGTSWSQQAKLTASDAAEDDYFGQSVSIDGDYAIVGAYGDDDGRGSAYIFKRDGTSWTEQAKLTASDAAENDRFGYSVSIDGDYAIVGAYQDAGTDSGSAYIFVRSGTTWTEQAKLTASDDATSDRFGYSVSISGDYAIVGAYRNNDDGSNSGSAYIFVRSGTTWSQQAKLTASDAAEGDYFGFSVSISGDYAIVGAYFDDDGGHHEDWNSGSAYIFVRSGTTWSQQAKLTASDAAEKNYFGLSASISGDYAIVGAYTDDAGNSGSAYVFTDFAPKPAISTSSLLNFWKVLVGSSATDSVKVKNVGTAPLSVSGIAVTGADSVLFTVTPATLTLAAGDSAYVKVTFTPGSLGAKAGSLGLTHNANGSPTSIPLTGTGTGPVIVTSSFLTFGDVPLVDGSVTVTSSIKIKNTGSTSLTVTPQNNMGGGFTVSPSQLTVSPSDSVKLAVALSATTVGRKDGSLVLNHNDTSKGSQTTIAVHANVYQSVQGTVVAWGDASMGQAIVPDGLAGVTGIAAGDYHSLALKSDGTVAAWGRNVHGQTNVPGGLTDVTAITGGGHHSLALKSDGTVVAWGLDYEGENDILDDLTGVVDIAGGGYHSLALKSDGTVVAWGSNGSGQTDVPPGLSDVTAIAAGLFQSLALKSDGTVVAWGSNTYDQTDVPDGLTGVIDIAGLMLGSMALKSDGTLVAWGWWNWTGGGDAPSGLTDVTAVSGGQHRSMVLKSDGTVVELILNDVPDGLTGVKSMAAGGFHCLALTGTSSGPSPKVKLVFKDKFGMRGEQLRVPVYLENNDSAAVNGLQFDVALPDSMFTFVSVIDSLGDKGFSVSAQTDSAGLTVAVFTLSHSILDESTEIAQLVYDVKPVPAGKVQEESAFVIHVSPYNTEVIDSLAHQVISQNVRGNYKIGIRGDANDDGSVSITDVVMTVRVILGRQPPPPPVLGTYAYALMDANGDVAINVMDVVIQVNRVLGKPIDQPLSRVVYSPVTVDLGHPVTSGTGIALPLSVVTGTPVSGLQLTYTFDPSRMTIGTPMLTAASDDVSLQWHIEDGTLNVIAYSLEGKAITLGPEGVMIPVTVPEGMRPEITLTNVILSDLYGNTVPVRLGQTRVSVAAAPTSFSLAIARPNPFNPSTTIAYEVPEQTHITLTVYNLLGQEMVRLVDQVQAAGRYEAVWNGTNITGAGVSSGIYLYRITSGSGYTETKRMTLLK